MGRRRGIAAMVGVVALLVLLWVSSAASEPVFRTPRLTFQIRLPQAERDHPEVPPLGDAGGLARGEVHAVPWYENPNVMATWAFTLFLTVSLSVVCVWSLRDLLRYRRLSRLRDERWQRDIVPDLLGEHVRAGHERLNRGTARNAIVAAWAALEDGADVAGLEPHPAETSQDFAQRAFVPWLPDAAPLEELASLYRRARFSAHAEVTEADRERAAAALTAVLAQLQTHAKEATRAR